MQVILTLADNSEIAVITSDRGRWTWTDLVDEFQSAIAAFARSRGIREADDVAQDVMQVAVSQLREFSGSYEQLRSYMFSIAHRRIADAHRRFYRRGELLTDDPTIGAEVSVSDDVPAESVVVAETTSEALALLGSLDGRSQLVLAMRIIEERPVHEVAERLGISAGNVRVIQSRALEQIRTKLEGRQE